MYCIEKMYTRRKHRGGAKENGGEGIPKNLRKMIATRGAINRLEKLQHTFIQNAHSKKEIKNLNEAIRGRAYTQGRKVNTRKRVGEKSKSRKMKEITRSSLNARPMRQPLNGTFGSSQFW